MATTRAVARWLDRHNGHSLHETQCRILKLSEEVGEVSRAWIGATGQNPRKGVTHSLADVADELSDVCLSSLVAMHSIGVDPVTVLARAATRIRARLAGAAGDPSDGLAGPHTAPCPVWTTPNRLVTEDTCQCRAGDD
ncbi:MazG-like family protein [Kibdelosporangium persicum]|uniref:MazG-like family protein n=1 Tax=Kibdelosporangium persicum TaxID=2698649 RepID=UPI001563F7CC|nr:MazG-like family protein [Kibdelosporangium persicum]